MISKKMSFYKPRKAGGGAAMQFDFNPEKACVFLEAANQAGAEQQFDWQKKIVFKMNETDLAKILAVTKGKEEKIDLFHDPSKSPGESTAKSTALSFARGERGFFAKLSKQNQDGSVEAVNLALSTSEGMMLAIFCTNAISKIFGF